VEHKENPDELLDSSKALMVGAGINTRDYSDRVPELIKAGADILCIDSSHGHTEWQKDTLKYIKKQYGEAVKVGAGNIVDEEGFRYLVKAGADFYQSRHRRRFDMHHTTTTGYRKRAGNCCIGSGKGKGPSFQRDRYLYPICSDGALTVHQIVLALAMGADFVMMGRFFAQFDESPSEKVVIGNRHLKEYWGEGTNRAQNWQRYDDGSDGSKGLAFEEGLAVMYPTPVK